jgi:hypothetical protein
MKMDVGFLDGYLKLENEEQAKKPFGKSIGHIHTGHYCRNLNRYLYIFMCVYIYELSICIYELYVYTVCMYMNM